MGASEGWGHMGAPCTMLLPLDLNRSMKKTENIFDKLPVYLMDLFPRRIPSYSLGRWENEFCSLFFVSFPPPPSLPFLSLPLFLSLSPFIPPPPTPSLQLPIAVSSLHLPSPYFSYLLPHWGPPPSSRLPQAPQDHHHDIIITVIIGHSPRQVSKSISLGSRGHCGPVSSLGPEDLGGLISPSLSAWPGAKHLMYLFFSFFISVMGTRAIVFSSWGWLRNKWVSYCEMLRTVPGMWEVLLRCQQVIRTLGTDVTLYPLPLKGCVLHCQHMRALLRLGWSSVLVFSLLGCLPRVLFVPHGTWWDFQTPGPGRAGEGG